MTRRSARRCDHGWGQPSLVRTRLRGSPWFAFALLLLACLPSQAEEGYLAGFAARKLEAALEQATGGDATLSGVELRPIDGVLTIADLSLSGGRGPLASLHGKGLTVAASSWQLLGGDLRILRIEADDLRIELSEVTEKKQAGESLDVRILSELRRVRIDHGLMVYRGSTMAFSLDADGLRILGEPAGGAVGGVVTAGPLQWRRGDAPAQEIATLQARWHWQAPRLTLEALQLTGDFGTVQANALVSFTGTGLVIRGDASGEVELEPLATAIGAQQTLKGRAGLKTRFRAAFPGDWAADGSVSAVTPITAFGESVNALDASFRAGPDLVELSGGRATLARGGVVEGISGRWDGRAISGGGVLSGPVSPWLQRFGVHLPGLASSTMQATVQLSQPDAEGFVRGVVSGRVSRGSAEGIDGEFTLTDEGHEATLDFKGRWGKAPFSVKTALSLDTPRTVGDWNARAFIDAPERESSAQLFDLLRQLARDHAIEVYPELHPLIQGGFQIDLRLAGRAAHTTSIDAYFVATSPRFGEERFDRLEGRARRNGRTWTVDARLANPLGQGIDVNVVLAPGRYPQVRARAADVPVRLLHFAVAALGGPALPPCTGNIDGLAVGGWGSGESMSVIAAGTLQEVHLNEAQVFVVGEVSPDAFEAHALHVSASAGQLDGDLRIALRGGGPIASGQLRAQFDLSQVPFEVSLPVASGQLELRVSGSLDDPDQPLKFSGEAAWYGVRVAGRDIPNGSGQIEPVSGGVQVALKSGPIDVDLALTGAARAPRLDINGRWRDLDLVALAEERTGSSSPLALSILSDGEVRLQGELRDSSTLRGTGRLTRLDIQGPTLGGSLEGPAPFHLDSGGTMIIDAAAPLVVLGDRGSRLTLHGSAVLFGETQGALDLVLGGAIDLGAVEVLHPDLLASGRLACDLKIGGRIEAPLFDGTVRATRGRLRLLPYPESVDGLLVALRFSGNDVTMEQGRFRLGGGEVLLDGNATLDGWLPQTLRIGLDARGVGLSVPRGVWGRYNGKLQLVGTLDEPEIRGRLEMIAGRYTREFGLGTFDRVRIVEPNVGGTSFWNRVGLNLKIDAVESVSIRNEMARMQASAQLDVSGTLRRPLLTGAIVLLEGGRMTFRDIEYEVINGLVTLDDAGGDPVELRLRASTSVRGYNITLELEASTNRVDYRLSSTPALPESDVLSLLITGQTQGEFGSDQGLLRTEAATTYFGSQLGELLLGNVARRALNIDQFSISPSQVGPETSPTARITVGRRLNERTRVIYSRDISAEGRDLYRLERDLTRDWRLTLGKEPLGGTALDARWLHRFGSGRDENVSKARRVRDLNLVGLPRGMSIRGSKLGLRRGTLLTAAASAEARDTLRIELMRAGYLEATLGSAVTEVPGPYRNGARPVDVTISVIPGPHWKLTFTGPKKLIETSASVLADLWSQTGIGPSGFRDEESVLKEAVADEGYSAAVVDITATAGQREITVAIDSGPQVKVARVSIAGNTAITGEQIQQQILSRPHGLLEGGKKDAYRPRLAREDADSIRSLYEEQGYLETQVKLEERLKSDGSAVELSFVIDEGQRWTIGALRVEGDWPESMGPATANLPIKSGDWYRPLDLAAAERSLRDTLDVEGYSEARVQSRVEPRPGHRLDAVFRVQTGRALTLRAIRYTGLESTRRKLVDRSMALQEGKPLTRRGKRDTERALYRLGLFRRVDLQVKPVDGKPGLADLVVAVEEVPRLSVLTSFGYDTEEQFRGSGSITNENLAGLARTGSLQGFLSAKRRNLRATLEDRYLRRGRLLGLGSLEVQDEKRDGYTVQTTGLTLQVGLHERALDRWQLRYVLEDNRFSDVTLDRSALDELLLSGGSGQRLDPIRLGAVIGSFVIDRRDDPFKPSLGWVVRSEAGVWSSVLASQASFVRLTGSATRLFPIGRRFTFVGGVRLGWSKTFGGGTAVPLSKRFFAGGSDSLRGFERESVGPLDSVSGSPIGGQVFAVANIEARTKLFSSLELVLFGDIGNVWLDTNIDRAGADRLAPSIISDPFGTMRTDAGIGIRYLTPVGALRLEYGFNLRPREFQLQPPDPSDPDSRGQFYRESSGKFYFSIGESF